MVILFKVPNQSIPSEVFFKGEIKKDHRKLNPPEDIIEVEVGALGTTFVITSAQIIRVFMCSVDEQVCG